METVIYGIFAYIIFVIIYGIGYTQYIKQKKSKFVLPVDEDGNLNFMDVEYVKPKVITFEFYNTFTSDRFVNLPLTPYIGVTIDKQLTEGFTTLKGEKIYGIIEYNIDLNWLGFVVGITYTRLTNKWME